MDEKQQSNRSLVFDALGEMEGIPVTTADLAEMTGLSNSQLHAVLTWLIREEAVVRPERGKYQLSEDLEWGTEIVEYATPADPPDVALDPFREFSAFVEKARIMAEFRDGRILLVLRERLYIAYRAKVDIKAIEAAEA